MKKGKKIGIISISIVVLVVIIIIFLLNHKTNNIGNKDNINSKEYSCYILNKDVPAYYTSNIDGAKQVINDEDLGKYTSVIAYYFAFENNELKETIHDVKAEYDSIYGFNYSTLWKYDDSKILYDEDELYKLIRDNHPAVEYSKKDSIDDYLKIYTNRKYICNAVSEKYTCSKILINNEDYQINEIRKVYSDSKKVVGLLTDKIYTIDNSDVYNGLIKTLQYCNDDFKKSKTVSCIDHVNNDEYANAVNMSINDYIKKLENDSYKCYKNN